MLAIPRTRKVTTVCNGKREVWTDYEQAKAYFLEMMMTAEVEERDRAECVYIQLIHRLDVCSDETGRIISRVSEWLLLALLRPVGERKCPSEPVRACGAKNITTRKKT